MENTTPPPLKSLKSLKNHSQSQENNAKSSKRYEPNNILIKNYLTQTGIFRVFVEKIIDFQGEKLKKHSELVKEKLSQYRKINGYKKKLVFYQEFPKNRYFQRETPSKDNG